VEVGQKYVEAAVRALRLKQVHAQVTNAGPCIEDDSLRAPLIASELQFDARRVSTKAQNLGRRCG